jgi:hypothetical protein
MSTAQVAAQKPRLHGVERGRRNRGVDDSSNTRADALFFRAQTLAIVRHFFEIASQIGRLPSILGREFFRAKVSHHAIPSFEEQAVFVHDVERALGRLNERDAEVVALVGLFHYSMEDVAAMLGRSRSTVVEHFADSVDHLAEMFLETGLLRDDRPDRRLKRFDVEESPQQEANLPPKKPAVSVDAEVYHMVGEKGASYSFVARSCKA